MNGWIIKFDETTPNPYFEDREKCASFPSVRIPHWAICEPFIGKQVEQGDFFFFAPMRTFLMKGFFNVRAIATEDEARKFGGKGWYAYRSEAVSRHSGVSRAGDVIFGVLQTSFWMEEGVNIQQFAFLPRTMFDSSRQANLVQNLESEKEILRLHHELHAYYNFTRAGVAPGKYRDPRLGLVSLISKGLRK